MKDVNFMRPITKFGFLP